MTTKEVTAPLVSVVMPAYNAAPYVEEAVASILGQTFTDFELIVVDDGSTDGTPAILARFAAADSRVRVHRQDNRGVARAANVACRLARGKYLARLDADDVAVPERLGLQVAFLEAHPEVAVVGGAKIFFNGDRFAPSPIAFPLSDREIRAELAYRCPFSHSTVMMRRDAFWALGGYRPPLAGAEDYELWLRMSERYTLANLPDVLVHYRIHRDQNSVQRRPEATMAGMAAAVLTRNRRAGGRDDLANHAVIDIALLESLGVGRAKVELAVARSFLGWARILTQFDDHDAATSLLGQAATRARAIPGWRRLAARGSLLQTLMICRLWRVSPRLFHFLKLAMQGPRELWWRLSAQPDGLRLPAHAEP